MKVALVTGASSGIGAAIAIEFADAGWSVMAAGRDEARLAEVADASENIATWEGDLAESEDCDELVADTVEEFDRLDCLVNSAGILIRADTGDTTDDTWRDTMAINLDVPFYLCRSAMPHLVDTAGSIANLSSYWGLRADPDHIAYCASKGGLNMMTRAIAKNHAADGVRVNAICPGGVDTPMLAAGAGDGDVDDFLVGSRRFQSQWPDRRAGRNRGARRLSRERCGSSHHGRTTIPIDGGLTA